MHKDENKLSPDRGATPESAAAAPENAEKKKTHKVRRRILIALGVLLLILALLGSIGLYYLHLWRSGKWQPSDELKQMVLSLADDSELMEYARGLKDSLKDLAACIQAQDAEGAAEARGRMQTNMKHLRRTVNSPLYLAATLTPGVGGELSSLKQLLGILEDADRDLIGPYLDLMAKTPLSGLNEDGGLRVDTVLSYVDFMETVLPKGSALIERLDKIDLSLVDGEGKISALVDKLSALLGQGDAMKDLFPAIRVVLGDGSDRLYIFAAQNSSEIRASGGFPGSVGTIRIRDGLLTISDFKSVYKVFQQTTPARAEVSYVEDLIFEGRLHLAWDSDFSPDFERVAEIWALSYEDRNHEKPDGVISGTPAIIQRMLAFLGGITLSDGTELNGENASRVLGHDLYFQYFGAQQQRGAADIVDGLFAEAAELTMTRFFSQMNAKTFLNFFVFFQESVADRTLMVWMADPEEQALIREAGWSAGLNADPSRPQAGIFYNSTAASKVAWFLNIEPELSEPVRNEDGSYTYELSVRFANVMTAEDRAQAGGYILGGTGGITGSMYVFAPAGGRIEEAVTESGYPLLRETYRDHELAYLLEYTIPCENSFVLCCRITTAPCEQEPMTLVVTPTMQDYR